MPNLTVEVAADQAPVVELVIAPTEARAEALKAAAGPIPPSIVVLAMLDTGAAISLITHRIAEQLNLDPGGERSVFGVAVAATETGVVYRVRLFFGGMPAVQLASTAQVIAVEDLTEFGVSMIVGRDLLSRCLLLYNGPDGRCTFAF